MGVWPSSQSNCNHTIVYSQAGVLQTKLNMALVELERAKNSGDGMKILRLQRFIIPSLRARLQIAMQSNVDQATAAFD